MAEKLSQKEFETKVLKAKGVVALDFFATWCGPCQMLGPVFEKVAKEMADKASLYKIDIDEEQDLAVELGVQAVPTVLIYKDGEIIKRQVGLVSEAALKKMIEEA